MSIEVTSETQATGTTVQEPQVGVQGNVNEQTEETLTLPSDTVEFSMPDKFEGKSAEDIARAYVELERLKGTQSTSEGEQAAEEAPEGQEEDNKYMTEFLETGELSKESYAELLEQGVTKEQVDDKLEYERYKSKKAVDEIVGVVGGIENYNAMEEWTQEAYTDEQRQAFVTEFQASGDIARQAMLRDTYSQYISAQEGSTVIHTNESQVVQGKGYTSEHEFQSDISDKRYGTDRSYTQAVEAKMAKTKGEWA